MVTPLSIYYILSLAANGVVNKTLEEMLKILSEKSQDELNKNNKLISSSFSNLKSIELANGVFTRFKPLKDFLNIIRENKAKLDELKNEIMSINGVVMLFIKRYQKLFILFLELIK